MEGLHSERASCSDIGERIIEECDVRCLGTALLQRSRKASHVWLQLPQQMRGQSDLELFVKAGKSLPMDGIRVAEASQRVPATQLREQLDSSRIQALGPGSERFDERARTQRELPFFNKRGGKRIRRTGTNLERTDCGGSKPASLELLERQGHWQESIQTLEADVLDEHASEIEQENSRTP